MVFGYIDDRVTYFLTVVAVLAPDKLGEGAFSRLAEHTMSDQSFLRSSNEQSGDTVALCLKFFCHGCLTRHFQSNKNRFDNWPIQGNGIISVAILSTENLMHPE